MTKYVIIMKQHCQLVIYKDAIMDEDWKQAISEELHILKKNNTRELVNPSEVPNTVIDSTWVFCEKKSDEW